MEKLNLEEIDGYPIPSFLAKRISDINGYDLDFAENLVIEAKRMLYLSAYKMEVVAPSGLVDSAWHEMLMFTKWYRDFCNFVGAFIHHEPTPPSEKREYLKKTMESKNLEKQKETPTYSRTKEMYKEVFGIEPDSKYWP